MSNSRNRHVVRFVAVAAVALAALTASGCSLLPMPSFTSAPSAAPETESSRPSAKPSAPAASGTAGSSSQAAQCAQVAAEITAIGNDLQSVGAQVSQNPLQALGILMGVSTRFQKLELAITDPELQRRIGLISKDWDAVVTETQRSISSGDVAAVQRISTLMQSVVNQIGELQRICTGS